MRPGRQTLAKPQSDPLLLAIQLGDRLPPGAGAIFCSARSDVGLWLSEGMSSVGHPARLKARLRKLFSVDRVITSVQLTRSGLLETAQRLDLPHITYTVRTRSTQASSAVDLTFYAGNADWLSAPPRDLMHWAILAEGRSLLGCMHEQEYRYVDLGGRDKANLPDAEVLEFDGSPDWAVEADAGYPRERVTQKIEMASRAGYGRLIWFTTVRERTKTLTQLFDEEFPAGLPGTLKGIDIYFTDIWSPNPYARRPRCHKPLQGCVIVRSQGTGTTTRRIRP